MINKKLLALFFCANAVLMGCSNGGLTGDIYSREDARKVQSVYYAEVKSVKPVIIEGNLDGVVGNLGGTIVGGIAGSGVGDGRGQSIATVVGAAVGGVLGQKAEEKITRKQGQEIELLRNDGKVLSVVQEVTNNQFFQPGDQVRLLVVNGNTRVSY